MMKTKIREFLLSLHLAIIAEIEILEMRVADLSTMDQKWVFPSLECYLVQDRPRIDVPNCSTVSTLRIFRSCKTAGDIIHNFQLSIYIA